MDSVTQIVLGAAVGEAVLGKKMGNKAIICGGIAGTIPDLDILFSPFMSEVDSLAFHRGISHSLLFSVIGGVFFGWLAFRFFNRKTQLSGSDKSNGSLRQWQWLFFLGLSTHSLLDTFTMYGTQLLAPFSDYRFAFNSISVADVFYTVPFIFCLTIAAFCKKGSRRRSLWNYTGLTISSLYLIFTLVNKSIITAKFESALQEQSIPHKNAIVGPVLLTNFLWNITVDGGAAYYSGKYSWFDKSSIKFDRIEKNHELIKDNNLDRTVNILRWFTKGYYNVVSLGPDKIQINDLRYGTFDNPNLSKVYIFRFELVELPQGAYKMLNSEGGPPEGEEKKMISHLIERVKGI